MSGIETAAAVVVWLAGLLVLLRYPIVVTGCGLAAMAWAWHPAACWITLGLTALASVARWAFGPSVRLLVLFPELAVALVAAAVAVLAGGQVAAGALAVLVLALGWFVRSTLIGIAGTAQPAIERPARPEPRSRRSPAPVRGFLGAGALRVDVGLCPSCGGPLVATGRTAHDPTRGPVFLAEANCTSCGQHLVGLGDASAGGRITWIDPDERREGIA